MNELKGVDLLKFIGKQQSQFVRPAKDFESQLRDFARHGRKPHGDLLPWSKTHNDIDFQPGRTTIWAGLNKSGKSVILGQALLHWKDQGVLIASLEMQPDASLHRIASQFAGKIPTAQDCSEFISSTPKMWIYNKTGAVDRKKILGLVYYAAEVLGCKHIALDSLMMCGLGRDDYAAEKLFVESLVNAARDAKIHVHLVCHMNKSGFDTTDELIGSRRFVRGAGEITDLVDACLVLARNRQREEEWKKAASGIPHDQDVLDEYDAYLRIDANRHYSEENTYGLMFDKASQSYHEGRAEMRAVA